MSYLLAFCLALCWGTAFLATKNIVDVLPPYWCTFFRVLTGLLFFVVLYGLQRKDLRISPKQLWRPWLIGFMLILLPFAALSWGHDGMDGNVFCSRPVLMCCFGHQPCNIRHLAKTKPFTLCPDIYFCSGSNPFPCSLDCVFLHSRNTWPWSGSVIIEQSRRCKSLRDLFYLLEVYWLLFFWLKSAFTSLLMNRSASIPTIMEIR